LNNKKPIRILHVVGAMNMGGTETMLMNIYRNIDREKVQFDFLSYSKEEAYYDLEIEGMGGRIIKLSNTQSIIELISAIKKYGPYDAVHAHTLFHCGIVIAAAKFAGVKKRIAHAHTNQDKHYSLVKKVYIRSMRNIINLISTDLLACSKEAASYLFGANCINDPRYIYFPNLIDYSKFLRDRQKEVNEFKVKQKIDNSIVIGHIGRFIAAKNQRFLLEIMKKVIKKSNNIKLVLVGDGELREEIEQTAIKMGIYDNLRFVGIRDDIPVMLQSMDIFVFPSIYEGLGLVLLEAQVSGVPCIVSDAIQPEADLGINLFTVISLKELADVWADKVLELAVKKENDKKKIVESLEKSGYSLTVGIKKLLDIYNVS
jgi:glycosyltransferase involved in cell wall biosynthesis